MFTPISSWKSVNRRNRDPRTITLMVCVADSLAGGRAAHAGRNRGGQTTAIRCCHRRVSQSHRARARPLRTASSASARPTWRSMISLPPLRRLKRALDVDPDWRQLTSCWAMPCWRKATPPRRFHTCNECNDKTGLGIAQIQTGQLPEAVANLQAALAERPERSGSSLLPRPRQRFAVEAID